METFRHKLKKRTILECFQLRLLAWLARRRSHKVFRFRWNRVIREWFRDLIEQPFIDRPAQRHEVRAFVSQQRLAKEFTHFSVDLAGAEIVVIETNLEAQSADFVVA